MDHYASLLAVAIVSLLAAISPGPDFVVVLRNSLVYSRKTGFLTACGISCALIIHLTYTLIGIGVLIAESPFIYAVLKYAGVSYLFYLGSKGVISSFNKKEAAEPAFVKSDCNLEPRAAFAQGFLTNLLNPKCALFFISLFSQFIDPNTPALLRIEYAFINFTISLGWFLFLAFLVTAKHLKGGLNRFQNAIDRVMGSALILLGMKLLIA